MIEISWDAAWLVAWYFLLMFTWLPYLLIEPSKKSRRLEPSEIPLAYVRPPCFWEPRVPSTAQLRGIGRWAYVALHPVRFGLWLDREEQRAVLWHEIAHYALGHTWKRAALGSLSTLVLCAGMFNVPWWAVPAFVLAWTGVMIRIVGVVWRGQEFDADEWASSRCDATALVRALARVTADWTAQTALHPSVAKRARFLGVDLDAIKTQLAAEDLGRRQIDERLSP